MHRSTHGRTSTTTRHQEHFVRIPCRRHQRENPLMQSFQHPGGIRITQFSCQLLNCCHKLAGEGMQCAPPDSPPGTSLKFMHLLQPSGVRLLQLGSAVRALGPCFAAVCQVCCQFWIGKGQLISMAESTVLLPGCWEWAIDAAKGGEGSESTCMKVVWSMLASALRKRSTPWKLHRIRPACEA